MKNLLKNLKVKAVPVIASLILFASVPALYAWTAPTQTPPNGNVAAPVNVGSIGQNKAGVLGLGGLAVFGKSLVTELSGYTLPASKPSMLLGVNGAIGAKEYCDQNGQNCVTTLGGGSNTSTSNTNTVHSNQKLAGWPNWVKCAKGNFEVYLDLSSRGNYGEAASVDKVFYFSGNGSEGSNLGIAYNFKNGTFAELIHRGTAGPTYAAVMDTCANKSINQVTGGY